MLEPTRGVIFFFLLPQSLPGFAVAAMSRDAANPYKGLQTALRESSLMGAMLGTSTAFGHETLNTQN